MLVLGTKFVKNGRTDSAIYLAAGILFMKVLIAVFGVIRS